MRSKVNKGGGASWLGIKSGKLAKVTDKADQYNWADVYLECEFTVEGSDYPRVMKIAGSFDRNTDCVFGDLIYTNNKNEIKV